MLLGWWRPPMFTCLTITDVIIETQRCARWPCTSTKCMWSWVSGYIGTPRRLSWTSLFGKLLSLGAHSEEENSVNLQAIRLRIENWISRVRIEIGECICWREDHARIGSAHGQPPKTLMQPESGTSLHNQLCCLDSTISTRSAPLIRIQALDPIREASKKSTKLVWLETSSGSNLNWSLEPSSAKAIWFQAQNSSNLNSSNLKTSMQAISANYHEFQPAIQQATRLNLGPNFMHIRV